MPGKDALSNPTDDGKGKSRATIAHPGVAVVGYGYWGLNLVDNFVDLDIARALSVSDLDPEKLTLVRRRHAGVEVANEFRELLTDPRVHAAAIATPVKYALPIGAGRAERATAVTRDVTGRRRDRRLGPLLSGSESPK